MCDAFNSMAQRLYLVCQEEGHQVTVHVAKRAQDMIDQVKLVDPHLILCPYLTKRIPEEIWGDASVPCLIVHPGIEGDRGMSSIDWALMEQSAEWGVTILQAAEEMDAGDIWATNNFRIRREFGAMPTKSSLYRIECIDAAVSGVRQAFQKLVAGEAPKPLDYAQSHVRGRLRPKMLNADRAVRWEASMDDIASKIRASDSQPGTLDEFFHTEYFLFGAHVEGALRLPKALPKTILGKRDGAILVSCGNGAVWITHLKQRNTKQKKFFKLPSTMALPPQIVQELPQLEEPRLLVEFGTFPRTFQEIFYWDKGGVCYLWFEFYNGAMSTEQCQRLCMAWDYIEQHSTSQVIVLMGGANFFSNGIHLNTIEAAAHPEKESGYNINAIDDFVKRILVCKKVTIATFQGNAGAGGVMMAMAADHVWAHKNVVLNPSYKAMDLYGSEYWTHTLPKRCGAKVAKELTGSITPLSANQAFAVGMVDDILSTRADGFVRQVLEKATSFRAQDEFATLLDEKAERINEAFLQEIEQCRKNELDNMSECFASPGYSAKRQMFVYKYEKLPCVVEH